MSAPKLGPYRIELEVAWEKLRLAASAYHEAATHCERVLDDCSRAADFGPHGSLAIEQAQQRESAALQEHLRLLGIFTDLVFDGTEPDEEIPDQ
jgi:hypothetical protein